MPTNVEEFNRRVRKFSADVPGEFRLVRDKLALQALTGLVNKTPVDTGRARGNWQLTVGQPGTGGEGRLDTGGGATVEQGEVELSGAPPFETVFITNVLPYIEVLENGHSGQAPGGMLALTFEELISQFG